jgi:hypothetical protein
LRLPAAQRQRGAVSGYHALRLQARRGRMFPARLHHGRGATGQQRQQKEDGKGLEAHLFKSAEAGR